jgi:hypothetical protein
LVDKSDLELVEKWVSKKAESLEGPAVVSKVKWMVALKVDKKVE